MRKFIWLLLFLFTSSLTTSAQMDGEKLEFGLGITPCLSWVNPNTKMVISGGSKLTFGFGAKINYHMSKKYALGFEVNLQNMAAKTHFNKILVEHKGITNTSNDFNLDYELRYIDIPVLLKMRTETQNNMAFYGEFGASIGFLLNQIADVNSDVLTLSQVNTEAPEDGDEFKLFNADNPTTQYDYKINGLKSGLIFGGGVHFHLGNNSLVELGVRYNLGLTDLYNESKWKGTNQALGLNVGFIF